VLKVVNSAYFGFPEPVENIARAVNMIGIAQLHNMVLGISAISSLDLPNDILPLDTFWRTSLFSGVLARLLAEQMKLADSDHLFIAGLLHEIGHLVLYSKFPLQALAAQRIAEDQGKQIHEAEMQVLGYHYGEIGAMLMANWNLPANLQSITRDQPDPASACDKQAEIALMHLAHACAQSETTGNPASADNPIDAEVLAMTGLTQEELQDSMGEARSISADMEKFILA
jgi:HD-like signal output (HDOD) protein